MKEQKEYLLQTMGIQVWKLRQKTAALTLVSFPLIDANEQTVARVVIDQQHLNNKKVMDLLIAMMTAIRFRLGDMVVCEQDCLVETPLLVLGKVNAQILPKLDKMVISFHPLELLQQPSLKAKAWQDLQYF